MPRRGALFSWYLPNLTCPVCGCEDAKELYELDFEVMCEHCVEETLEQEGALVADADNLCNNCGWGRKIFRFEKENLCLDCILERLEKCNGTDHQILRREA